MKKTVKYPVAGVGDLRAILEHQKFKCALTNKDLTPENTCFDHIVPMSKGGNSLRENLQAVTRGANLAKHDLEMKDFIELCAEVLSNKGADYGYKVTKK